MRERPPDLPVLVAMTGATGAIYGIRLLQKLKGSGIENVAPILEAVSREQFFNTSKLDLPKLLDDPANIAIPTRLPSRLAE